jgi:hypothetical protein
MSNTDIFERKSARNSDKRLVCSVCRVSFVPQRATARYCGYACRKAAQRNRDRGGTALSPPTAPAVAVGTFLSVTATRDSPHPQKDVDVTLRPPISRAPKPALPEEIVPDAKWPGMYRIRRPNGSLSDMVNLTRVKDALANDAGGA